MTGGAEFRGRGGGRRWAGLAVCAAACFLLVAAAARLAPAATGPIGLTVTATDAKLALSRASVPVGAVAITFVNRGKAPRALVAGGKRTAAAAPGASVTLAVSLARPGKAVLQAGSLRATLLVTAAPTAATALPSAPAAAATTTAAPEHAPAAAGAALIGDPVAGKALFLARSCGGCHALARADAMGGEASSLDLKKPSQAIVLQYLRNGATEGATVMQGYGSLGDTALNDIAAFVYQASQGR